MRQIENTVSNIIIGLNVRRIIQLSFGGRRRCFCAVFSDGRIFGRVSGHGTHYLWATKPEKTAWGTYPEPQTRAQRWTRILVNQQDTGRLNQLEIDEAAIHKSMRFDECIYLKLRYDICIISRLILCDSPNICTTSNSDANTASTRF